MLHDAKAPAAKKKQPGEIRMQKDRNSAATALCGKPSQLLFEKQYAAGVGRDGTAPTVPY